ncbi:MAG: endonuclease domain-containing protein [Bacteroidia bacterium]|nr:endonuclease domain-containing protein [Bacteroidia bacterium]
MKAEMTIRARELRKNQTPAEILLWSYLRAKRFHGLKFLRQHPIYFNEFRNGFYYIADFYCASLMLVIELDGAIHQFTKEYDSIRDQKLLEGKGLFVLRLRNEEIFHFNAAEQKIKNFITQNCHPKYPLNF